MIRRAAPKAGADAPAARLLLGESGAEHLPDLTDLWVAAWQATMPDIDFAARRTWFTDNFRARTADGTRTLMLQRDGVLAGFVMIDPATGYLDQIAVAPACRGAGIAAQLLDAAKALSPRGIDLHVNTENARAVRFYRKHGFSVTDRGVNACSGRPVHKMSWRP